MSCSSYLDGFRDVRQVAIQVLFCGSKSGLFNAITRGQMILPFWHKW